MSGDIRASDMRIGLDFLQGLDTVTREHEGDRALADLTPELLQHQRLEIRLVVNEKDGSGHAACPSLESISWRSAEKSIGLVR